MCQETERIKTEDETEEHVDGVILFNDLGLLHDWPDSERVAIALALQQEDPVI